MKAPIVQKFMTRLPLEIEKIDNVANAKQLMELFDIRHVPVMGGLHLKGVVSEHDVLEASVRHPKNVDELPIEEVCVTDVLTVSPITPIDVVAQKMLDRGVGSAVVVDGEYVVGIFTKTDALKVLTSILKS